jgi:hemerythrin-like domain-containing protein
MANDPMQLLLGEHEIISKAGEVITAMDGRWETRPDAYEAALRDLISFFVSYSDGFHHRKEEIILFPALRKHPDFYTPDILDELEDHHQTFRDHVGQLEAAIAEQRYEAAQARLQRYFKELLDHIAMENDELFVMAGSVLSESELERMYFQFQDVDRELGEERKTELEQRLAGIRMLP